MGWVIFVGYVAAAYLCFRATRRPASADLGRPRAQSRAFWYILAVILIALGLNKQLDLQILLTQFGRQLARTQGWYNERRGFQKMFVECVAILGVAGVVLLGVLVRRALLRQGLALVGLVFLVCLVIIRAASLHQVDAMLGVRLAGLKLHRILELAGIVCIAISAGINAEWRKPS